METTPRINQHHHHQQQQHLQITKQTVNQLNYLSSRTQINNTPKNIIVEQNDGKKALKKTKFIKNSGYNKKFGQDLQNNEENRMRLRKEGKIMSLFNSPYIMQCQVKEEQGVVQLIMEYCPQGSLSSFLQKGNGRYLKNEKFFKSILHDILQGICLLHENNIVHCDIKCENILLRNNHAVLIDFGESISTQISTITYPRGSPLYISPEMIHGNVGTFCDIWSFGAVICAMGWAIIHDSVNIPGIFPNPWNQPFSNKETLFWRIGNGDKPKIPSWFSTSLCSLVEQCFLPEKRRPSARQLLREYFT